MKIIVGDLQNFVIHEIPRPSLKHRLAFLTKDYAVFDGDCTTICSNNFNTFEPREGGVIPYTIHSAALAADNVVVSANCIRHNSRLLLLFYIYDLHVGRVTNKVGFYHDTLEHFDVPPHMFWCSTEHSVELVYLRDSYILARVCFPSYVDIYLFDARQFTLKYLGRLPDNDTEVHTLYGHIVATDSNLSVIVVYNNLLLTGRPVFVALRQDDGNYTSRLITSPEPRSYIALPAMSDRYVHFYGEAGWHRVNRDIFKQTMLAVEDRIDFYELVDNDAVEHTKLPSPFSIGILGAIHAPDDDTLYIWYSGDYYWRDVSPRKHIFCIYTWGDSSESATIETNCVNSFVMPQLDSAQMGYAFYSKIKDRPQSKYLIFPLKRHETQTHQNQD